MKSIPAILSAFVITAVVGISMLVIGANALFNPNTTAMASSAAPAADVAPVSSVDAQTGDMQALIQQYQDREKQYQQRLDEAVQKLNAANQRIQQANDQLQQANQTIQNQQNILEQMQQNGLIRIDQSGQVTLAHGKEHHSDDD